MIINIKKSLLEEGVVDHLKRHSGKYLAGAGLATGVGLSSSLGLGDTTINNNTITSNTDNLDDSGSTLGTVAGAGLAGAGAMTLLGRDATSNKQLGKNIADNTKNVVKATVDTVNKGVGKTKDWIEKEKALENPVKPQRPVNPVFNKSSNLQPRDLDKPTDIAMKLKNTQIVPTGNKRRKPLTKPKLINAGIQKLRKTIASNPNWKKGVK